MRHLHRYVLIALLILWPAGELFAASAAAPDDFAYGMPLFVESAGGLNALPLPDAVYAALVRADYGDLRVFNRAGKAVAHTLHIPEHPPAPEAWVPVGAFPLPAEPATGTGGSRIRIETRADGSIIEVRPAAPDRAAAAAKVTAHVLDLSDIDLPVDRLQVRFSPAHRGLTGLVVAHSEDLARWHTIVTTAALGHLDYQGHRLERGEVALPVRRYTYLRLSWSKPLDPEALATTAVREPVRRQPPPRTTLRLTAPQMERVDGRTYLYFTANGHRPTDRVRIDMPVSGTLARFSVASRSRDTAAWRHRCSGLAYRLHQGGVELVSEAIPITVTADPHWRLEVQSDPSLLTRLPTLELSGEPHRLVFAATDGGPFRLAFGSTRVSPAVSHLDELLRTLDGEDEDVVADLPLAQAGEPYDLSGARMLAASNDDWKRWLLWGGMIAAVALIGGMALRLYGQVKRAGDGAMDEDGVD